MEDLKLFKIQWTMEVYAYSAFCHKNYGEKKYKIDKAAFES